MVGTRESRKQLKRSMFAQENLEKLNRLSGVKAEIGNALAQAYLTDGSRVITGMIKQDAPLSGAIRVVWEHDPIDGDDIEFQHLTDNSFRIFNQTTDVEMLRLYRDGTVGGLSVQGIESHQLADEAKSAEQNIESMRRVGRRGTSNLVAAENHYHDGVDINRHYSPDDMSELADIRAQVETMIDDRKYSNLRPVLKLLLEVAHQMVDEPDMRLEEKAQRLREDRAFAHEFYMKHDEGYYAAWMLENDPDYRAKNENDQRIVNQAANARSKHGTIESDPQIVREYNRVHQGRL